MQEFSFVLRFKFTHNTQTQAVQQAEMDDKCEGRRRSGYSLRRQGGSRAYYINVLLTIQVAALSSCQLIQT